MAPKRGRRWEISDTVTMIAAAITVVRMIDHIVDSQRIDDFRLMIFDWKARGRRCCLHRKSKIVNRKLLVRLFLEVTRVGRAFDFAADRAGEFLHLAEAFVFTDEA